MGEWCFREKAESFAERLWRARWRIPDCERALLASGQKNRCEVVHALSLPSLLSFSLSLFFSRFGSGRMSAHFLAVRHSYLHRLFLSTFSLSLYSFSLSLTHTYVFSISLFSVSFTPFSRETHDEKANARSLRESAQPRPPKFSQAFLWVNGREIYEKRAGEAPRQTLFSNRSD